MFGSSYSGRCDHHRLHLCQIDVASAVCVFSGVVVPHLWRRERYNLQPISVSKKNMIVLQLDSPGVLWCPTQTSEVSSLSAALHVYTGSPRKTWRIKTRGEIQVHLDWMLCLCTFWYICSLNNIPHSFCILTVMIKVRWILSQHLFPRKQKEPLNNTKPDSCFSMCTCLYIMFPLCEERPKMGSYITL